MRLRSLTFAFVLTVLSLSAKATPYAEALSEVAPLLKRPPQCGVYLVERPIKHFQVIVDSVYKDIYINKEYWNVLDRLSRRIILIRELLHCEAGVPYVEGHSIMNRKITIARMVYEYGA